MIENNGKTKAAWSSKDWILLAANALVFLIMFFAFNHRLPGHVSSHFNVNGELDRTMTKWSFWLFTGIIGVALPSFISGMRYVDPRRSNFSRFEGYFDLLRWTISLLLQALILLLILVNLGYKLPILSLVLGGIGILWIVLGNRMGQLRSNFIVGIRTPWALMDEDTWRLTHRLGARLWVAGGILMFTSAWFIPASWVVWVLLLLAAGSTVIPAAYSYFLYRAKFKPV